VCKGKEKKEKFEESEDIYDGDGTCCYSQTSTHQPTNLVAELKHLQRILQLNTNQPHLKFQLSQVKVG
jgi:hypothetical protein